MRSNNSIKYCLKKIKETGIMFLIVMMCMLSAVPCSAASKSGTAKVWAGVPLVGHVYVCTPYSYNYKTKTVNKKKTKVVTSAKAKESYTSAGVALITYEHYSSWTKIRSGKKSFDVYAKGHCDFVFKGCPVSLGLQTFVKTINVK